MIVKPRTKEAKRAMVLSGKVTLTSDLENMITYRPVRDKLYPNMDKCLAHKTNLSITSIMLRTQNKVSGNEPARKYKL